MMPSEASAQIVHPAVTWAQRTDKLFINFMIQDAISPSITVNSTKVSVKSDSKDGHKYSAELVFYKPVTTDDVQQKITGRTITLIIPKEKDESYWPRLLENSSKEHWLKVDFGQWKDEDDSEDEAPGQEQDFQKLMSQMGGDSGYNPGDDAEYDSDDDSLPDLEAENQIDDKTETAAEPKLQDSGDIPVEKKVETQ